MASSPRQVALYRIVSDRAELVWTRRQTQEQVTGELWSTRCGSRHSLEHELLHASTGQRDVEIALGIGGDVMPAADQSVAADEVDNFERLAIHDHDVHT